MCKRESFINEYPLDWSRREVQELHKILSNIYYNENQVIRLVRATGIPVGDIRWNISMSDAWNEIFEKAHNRGLLDKMFNVILTDESISGYHARINELLLHNPIIEAPLKSDIGWKTQHPRSYLDIEKVLCETNPFYDVTFLHLGIQKSKSVVRLVVTFKDMTFHGTGFLISDNYILTNFHVLINYDKDLFYPENVELWFNYEKDIYGGLKPYHVIKGDIQSIVGNRDVDWATIKIDQPTNKRYNQVGFATELPTVDDRVYIIQHPNGALKQIGMHNNIVRYVDDRIIEYYTSTDRGSSGSPVFNSDWEVVALHQGSQTRNGPMGIESINRGINIQLIKKQMESHGIHI